MPNTGQSTTKYLPQFSYGASIDNIPFVLSEYKPEAASPTLSRENTETNNYQFEKVSSKENTEQKFWTTKKIIILVACVTVVAAVAGTVVAVLMTRQTDSTTTSTSTTSTSTTDTTTTTTSATTTTVTTTTSVTTTTTTSTTTTTTTSTTTTTTPANPCSLGNLRWNTTGTTIFSSWQISTANGLYIDSNNTLYAVDEYSTSVIWKILYNTTTASYVAGVYLSAGSSSSQFNYPQDVYVDTNGSLYVTDNYNYRIQYFVSGSSSATTIAGINGSAGSALSLFNGIRYITVDTTNSYIYAADYYNNRIMRYSTSSTSGTNGVLVAGGNGAGNTNSTLYYPFGIHQMPTVSSDLFITNYNGHSVIRWTPGASSGYFVAGVPGVTGQSPVLLNNPTGIKVDRYLNMYVVDSGNHRVQMFCANDQTGITIAGTGLAGSAATQLNSPRSIAFDSFLNLYITDRGNSRIQKFMKL